MPKLASDIARRAEKAHAEGGPKPIPEGIYVGRLFNVEVSDKPGDSGYHYWTWFFKIQSGPSNSGHGDDGYSGKEQRLITSLSPNAEFAFGAAFEAFGVPADTDTDEICGKLAMLHISQQPISRGPRAGEIGNRVERVAAFEGPADGQAAAASDERAKGYLEDGF